MPLAILALAEKTAGRDRKTGDRIWTHFSAEKKKPNDFIPGFQSSPTATGDLVLIGDDGMVHDDQCRVGLFAQAFATATLGRSF